MYRVDCTIPPDDRADIIEQFKNHAGKALLVAHGNAVAEGIDLSFAQYMLVYNIPWNRAMRKFPSIIKSMKRGA